MSLTFNLFKNYPQLSYGLSLKTDGNMKVQARQYLTGQNRQSYLGSKKIYNIVLAEVCHSAKVHNASSKDSGMFISGVDGLVAKEKDLYLGVTVADCFPVYFFDPIESIVAIAHAGWRGVVDGIISEVMKTMGAGYKSNPKNVLIAVGPGIQQHHFEIHDDVAGKFQRYLSHVNNQKNQILVDLSGIICEQALEFGVPSGNIELSQDCTFCQKEKYFSFRRDHPEEIKAMLAYIGIRTF